MSASCSPADLSALMAAALDWCCPTFMNAGSSARPIGTFELMQAKVADMYTDLSARRA